MKNIEIFVAVHESDREKIINGDSIDDWGSAHVWCDTDKVGYELNLSYEEENSSAYYRILEDNNGKFDTDTSDPVPCTVDFAADDWEQQLARELLELVWR